MQKATLVTKQFIACPHCGEATGYTPTDTRNAEWEHTHLGSEGCGKGFKYIIKDGDRFVEALDTQPDAAPILSLLVLPPQKQPVYFILGNTGYRDRNTGKIDLDRDYYYNDHSCPTNWFTDIRAMIIGDDADPHGLLQHVRSTLEADADAIMEPVRLSQGYEPGAEGSSDTTTDWLTAVAVFPEINPQGEIVDMEIITDIKLLGI